MKKYIKIIGLLVVIFIVFSSVASAALVPCGPGTDKTSCEVCDIFTLVDNIIKFISIDIAPSVALILIVIGAIMMMTAAGSQTNYDKGKGIITWAIIGIFMIWGSWLVIDTVMKSFPNVESKFGVWNEIECAQ